jgi:phosphotriesterase-related protein
VIQTLTGPIHPEALGPTLTHEHLLVDATVYWDPAGPLEAADPDRPVELPLIGRLRRDPTGVTRENLRIDDPLLVLRELEPLLAAGVRSLVDLTPRGAGFDPGGVLEIARATGLQIIAGTAWYLERTHPPELALQGIEEITEAFVRDLEVGFAEIGDRARAGIIGEIGTSDPIGPGEKRVLRAAARAQRRTGAPLNVHLEEWGANGDEVLSIVEAEGGDPSRTALSHLDSRLDHDYHLGLARRGAYVSYDLWGTEEYRIRERRGNPSDAQRARAVADLVEAGAGDRILLSTDICTKTQLVAYGGYGYAHVVQNVVPMLRDIGLSEAEIDGLLVDNPRRFLAGER